MAKRKKYSWGPGSTFAADAQRVGTELDKLQKQHGGRLTPRVVVDAAREPGREIHRCFEWDDVRAAELYRENRARDVMQHVRVELIPQTADEEPLVVRAFVNLTEGEQDALERGYIPIARVLSDGELYAQTCERAARELDSMAKRYAGFQALSSILTDAAHSIQSVAVPQ